MFLPALVHESAMQFQAYPFAYRYRFHLGSGLGKRPENCLLRPFDTLLLLEAEIDCFSSISVKPLVISTFEDKINIGGIGGQP